MPNPPKNDTPYKALVEQCDWPEGGRFTFHDEPGEHDPCYVVMPDGAALPLNHHAGEGVDIARAQFIITACNAAQHGGLVDARWRPEVVAFADLMEQQLRANDHKPGWKSDTAIELARRLNQESDELWGVLNEMDPGRAQAGDAVLPEQYRELSEQAGREAADVANFAMMIADVCGALPSALAANSPVVGEDALPNDDDEGPCTDCYDTGVTIQTERRCACQPTPTDTADRKEMPDAVNDLILGSMGKDFERKYELNDTADRREAVARIIDPLSWISADASLSDAEEYEAMGATKGAEQARKLALAKIEDSLRKADAILTLVAEPERAMIAARPGAEA